MVVKISSVLSLLPLHRGFLLGGWLNGSRRVAEWDGSDGDPELSDFYEVMAIVIMGVVKTQTDLFDLKK